MVKRQRISKKPSSTPPEADSWVNAEDFAESSSQKETASAPPSDKQESRVKGKSSGGTYPHRLSFDMETAQYRRLKRAAFEQERSMNEIIREAVDQWLETSDY